MNIINKPDEKLARILPPVFPKPETTYVPSQFAIAFEHRGKHYLLNNLTKQCIEGELPDKTRAGVGYDELITAQFLVPENKDECAYYNQISSLMRTFGKKKGIRTYTILPTLGCNARCIYCYEEGMKQVTMTDEIVEQTIRFILNTTEGDAVRLGWFGGEPLMFPGTIDRICEGMREAGIKYKSSMISNGSLITPEIIRKMKDDWNLKSIQVSMDGAEEDYIFRKNYRTPHDYYHTVMDALSRMSEAGITVTVRCNVDEENWERIPRFLEDLKSGVTNKEKIGLYFGPLNDVRKSENDLSLWSKIVDAREEIVKAGFRASPFASFHFHFRTNHCMADGSGVVIAPDGSLYPCEHCPPESRYGDVWNGITDEEARRDFCSVDQIREMCRACPFLPDCTGFSHCPVQEFHCRELRHMMAIDALKRMLDRQAEKDDNEGTEEVPVC